MVCGKNGPPVSRRRLSLFLLLAFTTVLFSGIAFTSACNEPCADDEPGQTDCPPDCALCISCAHMQQAVLGSGATPMPQLTSRELLARLTGPPPTVRASDILHIPLVG